MLDLSLEMKNKFLFFPFSIFHFPFPIFPLVRQKLYYPQTSPSKDQRMSNIWQWPPNKRFTFSNTANKCDHHNYHPTLNINPLHKAEYRGRPTPLSSSPLAYTPPHCRSLRDRLGPPLALIGHTRYRSNMDQIY